MVSPRPTRPVVGILWMFVTGLCFVAVTALVKYLGTDVPPTQSAFIRYFMGLLFLVPLLPRLRRQPLTRRLWALFGSRGMVHSVGVGLWFFSMTRIPLAEVTAMNYLSPVFVTLGAAMFLGERLAARRIAAVCVALIGAVIILRPGFREVNAGHLSMLIAGMAFSASFLLGKITTDETTPEMVITMLSLWVTAGLAPFALLDWVPIGWRELSILFTVALFATAGHYTMSLAFAAAPIAVTQPVTFLQLIWAVALGVVIFGEAVDIYVILGGGLIMAAISFIAWREAVVIRRSITPPTPATKV